MVVVHGPRSNIHDRFYNGHGSLASSRVAVHAVSHRLVKSNPRGGEVFTFIFRRDIMILQLGN